MKLESGHFESNAKPILKILKQELTDHAKVLEVASGYGQHVVYFAENLAQTHWQPSDIDGANLSSIQAHVNDSDSTNLEDPLYLDVREPCSFSGLDAIVSINLLHVSGVDTCDGLLNMAGNSLNPNGKLFLYGPFIRDDVETAPSNLMFDQRLKMRDPSWGIPVLQQLSSKAGELGLQLKCLYELPSNNVVVVFEKTAS